MNFVFSPGLEKQLEDSKKSSKLSGSAASSSDNSFMKKQLEKTVEQQRKQIQELQQSQGSPTELRQLKEDYQQLLLDRLIIFNLCAFDS